MFSSFRLPARLVCSLHARCRGCRFSVLQRGLPLVSSLPWCFVHYTCPYYTSDHIVFISAGYFYFSVAFWLDAFWTVQLEVKFEMAPSSPSPLSPILSELGDFFFSFRAHLSLSHGWSTGGCTLPARVPECRFRLYHENLIVSELLQTRRPLSGCADNRYIADCLLYISQTRGH